MAKQRPTISKLNRERDKQLKAAEKQAQRERRAERNAEDEKPEQPPVDQTAILNALAELHEAHAKHLIALDEFEARRDELTRLLVVD